MHIQLLEQKFRLHVSMSRFKSFNYFYGCQACQKVMCHIYFTYLRSLLSQCTTNLFVYALIYCSESFFFKLFYLLEKLPQLLILFWSLVFLQSCAGKYALSLLTLLLFSLFSAFLALLDFLCNKSIFLISCLALSLCNHLNNQLHFLQKHFWGPNWKF